MSFVRSTRRQVFILCLFLTSAGCQSTGFDGIKGLKDFDLAERIPWGSGGNRRDHPPERLVGFWTESVLHKSDGNSERGFGGRVYFYDRKDSEPIEVDGQLVVYAFDEENRVASDNTPTRRYVFPPEQFAKHFSESELGPSYSIWLPWDDVGGQQKSISLIARFRPKNGAIVVSKQSEHRLPGTQSAEVQLATESQPADGLRQASYEAGESSSTGSSDARAPNVPDEKSAAKQASGAPLRRMTTTSIALPKRVGQKVPGADVRNSGRSNTSAASAKHPSSREVASPRGEPSHSNGGSPTASSRRDGYRPARRLARAAPFSPPPAFRTLSRSGPTAQPYDR